MSTLFNLYYTTKKKNKPSQIEQQQQLPFKEKLVSIRMKVRFFFKERKRERR